MLTVTSSLSPAAVANALGRAGFTAVDVQITGGDLVISGANSNRLDEFGGHAIIEEDDRAAVETVLTELGSTETKKARVRELQAKSTLSAAEQVEAIRLFLDLAVLED